MSGRRDFADNVGTADTATCDMVSLITIVVAVSVIEATTEPMVMEDRGPIDCPIGLIGPMDGPNGSIFLTGEPIGPYEPKSPTLRMISYDSYDPLSCI